MPPAARASDLVIGNDQHRVSLPDGKVVVLAHPFQGPIEESLSQNVLIEREPAAVVGSIARNDPAHVPAPPGIGFVTPPENRGRITQGSTTVLINGKGAARVGDPAATCSDAPNAPGEVLPASGRRASVLIDGS